MLKYSLGQRFSAKKELDMFYGVIPKNAVGVIDEIDKNNYDGPSGSDLQPYRVWFNEYKNDEKHPHFNGIEEGNYEWFSEEDISKLLDVK